MLLRSIAGRKAGKEGGGGGAIAVGGEVREGPAAAEAVLLNFAFDPDKRLGC